LNKNIPIKRYWQKSGLIVSRLGSQSKGREFKSHTLLDGNGFKAMPESILYPILVKSGNEKGRKYR